MSKGFIPFRYQGQYEDIETGLYYNRFRYYSPESGTYISQDPIGLLGGKALYGYVHDSNGWARATSSRQRRKVNLIVIENAKN
ncbi:RHS repeat-associated core domain-containing protein [Capnocytophaga bilenii]